MKKTFKIIGIAFLIIIAIPLIAAFFVNSKYAVERETTINKPPQQVYDYAKFLKNQNDYSVWAKMDPNMKKEYRGTDGTVGFVSAWESTNKEVGKGEQEITGLNDSKRIDFELRFMEPFESTEKAYMIFDGIDSSSVKVIWGFNGKMDYPMNLMLLFMDMEGIIGKDLQTGLDNMKNILEK